MSKREERVNFVHIKTELNYTIITSQDLPNLLAIELFQNSPIKHLSRMPKIKVDNIPKAFQCENLKFHSQLFAKKLLIYQPINDSHIFSVKKLNFKFKSHF